MELQFRGEVWFWRGPSPWHFVTVPPEEAEQIADLSGLLTYGWGMVPATVRIGRTAGSTSLWPKDGGYVVPLKAALRTAEQVEVGQQVDLVLTLG